MTLRLIISVLVILGVTACEKTKKKEAKPEKEEISAEAQIVIEEIDEASQAMEQEVTDVKAATDQLAEEMGIEK